MLKAKPINEVIPLRYLDANRKNQYRQRGNNHARLNESLDKTIHQDDHEHINQKWSNDRIVNIQCNQYFGNQDDHCDREIGAAEF